MRQARTIGMAALAVVLAGTAGCKGAGTGGSSGAPTLAVDVAPNADTYTIQRLAILGYANTSGRSEATQVSRYVEAALSQTGVYRVSRAGSLKQDAERSNVADQLRRAVNTWEKARKVDASDLGPLCEATGFDGIVAWEVSQWSEEKLDVTQEGTSNTTVEVRIEMYAADGTLLWSGRGRKVAESQPYNPDLAVSSTQTGQAVYDASMVPDPPPILPVAQEVVNEVVKTMPNLGPKPEGEPGTTAPASSGTETGGW